DRERGAHLRADRRRAGLARRLARLDRWHLGGVRAAVGLALPEDELDVRLYAATGEGMVRVGGVGAGWTGERVLAVSGAQCVACGVLASQVGVRPRPRWSFLPCPATSHVRGLAPSPHAAALLLVGIELGGFMRPTDGGQSWQHHRPGAQPDVHSLAWHPHMPG